MIIMFAWKKHHPGYGRWKEKQGKTSSKLAWQYQANIKQITGKIILYATYRAALTVSLQHSDHTGVNLHHVIRRKLYNNYIFSKHTLTLICYTQILYADSPQCRLPFWLTSSLPDTMTMCVQECPFLSLCRSDALSPLPEENTCEVKKREWWHL